MLSLLGYLKGYRKEAILAPVFKMLEAFFELLIPLILIRLIDVGIGERNQTVMIQQGIFMVCLGIIGFISAITAQYFAAKAAVFFAAKLRGEVMERLVKFSFAKIDQYGTSTLINRMSQDMNQIQTGVNMILRLFLRSPFIVFGSLFMAFRLDRKAGFFFVYMILLLSVLVFIVLFTTLPLYEKIQRRMDGLLLLLKENLSGVRVIRAFVGRENEVRHYEEQTEILYRLQKRAAGISAILNPGTYFILNIFMVLLIYTGAIRIDAGNLTKGLLIALLNYMTQILGEFVKFANLMLITNKTVISGRRVWELLESTEGEESLSEFNNSDQSLNSKEIPNSSEIAVEFVDVNLQYHSNQELSLSHISFQAKKGQFIGITGPTGSGKTSVLNLITGFYEPSGGMIRIDGRDSKEISKKTLRNKIGIVLQKAVLFQRTIEENIRLGNPDCSREEIWEALELANAKDFVEEKSEGLSEMLYQRGNNLSGGQKQRLSIARALVKKPEILILDDSTSALDYRTEQVICEAIRNLTYKPTIFFVSQRIQSIQDADVILVMDQGKLVGEGSSQELLKRCDVYQELYYSQENQQKG